MALSTQTRSAGSALPWKYDVFLSFRGADTRKGFTDYLYDKLQWQGIRTFRDDPQLERGTDISPELLAAIEQSRFAIVVLSPNYATSKWCLLELSKIVRCMEERARILPIFYGVEPSDVKHQRGSFAEAFVKHEEELGAGNTEVEKWRDALTKVASLAGWTAENYRYETELIKEIVQKLWNRVHPSLTVFGSSEKLVGMYTKMKEIEVLLDKEANDVRFIGIWGMGGLGKTTLARLVYEKISHQFEVSIFLADVRRVSATHGLVHLQRQILSQILKDEHEQVRDGHSGINLMKRCFHDKAVLLVLDDVDQSVQVDKLMGNKDCFGLRSRIIITTRDQHVLVTNDVEEPYKLETLNETDALKLFSWKAFRKDEPEEDYAEQSKRFVRYARGLPLALEVLGSFLYKRSRHSWSSELQKLQHIPNPKVFDVLKISFDGLDKVQKKIFLDIACFRRLDNIMSMIELVYSSEFCPLIVIEVLVEKSLITISSDNQIRIHDKLQEMGCEIVRQESYDEPGGRTRLWLHDDIFHVFTKNKGTEVIEGILLHLSELEVAGWNLEAFSKMHKLKMLYIDNLRLSLGPKCLPDALRYLQWSWYPSESLPPCFQPDELTELSLVHSNIHHLWNGIKNLGKLKSIDLSYSINLTRTPDFTGIPNLEKLVLEGCTNLVEIHPSIALLKRLKVWNFRNCKSIKSLPNDVQMEFLETFDVSGCSKLKMIPKFVGQTKRLSKICVGGTAVENLHSSLEHLHESLMELDLTEGIISEQPYSLSVKLQNLMVSSFGSVIRERPYSHTISSFGFFPRKSPHPLIPLFASLKHFSSLTTLKLNNYNLCEGEIPNDLGYLSSLATLELRGNNFVSLPASIHLLSKLEFIDVQDCKMLQKLPNLPVTRGLLKVNTDNCTSLQVFAGSPNLCSSRIFDLSCINSIIGYPDSSNFLYSALKRFLEAPTAYQDFRFVIPGSEIPVWFSNHSVGNSITEKLPSVSSNSKMIGIAVCALISPEENLSAVPEAPGLDPGTSGITWWWYDYFGNSYEKSWGQIYPLNQIVSDHLFIVVTGINDLDNEVTFDFETTRAVGSNRCLKIKKCGARALFEHDMEETISRMNQSKSSISLYEATDEQEGAIVEATTSTSGGSDDEYYSAEE